jgi:hypothetical protein
MPTTDGGTNTSIAEARSATGTITTRATIMVTTTAEVFQENDRGAVN